MVTVFAISNTTDAGALGVFEKDQMGYILGFQSIL